jgi:hypothetical protein
MPWSIDALKAHRLGRPSLIYDLSGFLLESHLVYDLDEAPTPLLSTYPYDP